MRVYGPSATANFTGFRTIVGNLPVEVVVAIPLYLALVICFIRYLDRISAPDLKLVTTPAAPAVAAPEPAA
jgi:hypothetical protein